MGNAEYMGQSVTAMFHHQPFLATISLPLLLSLVPAVTVAQQQQAFTTFHTQQSVLNPRSQALQRHHPRNYGDQCLVQQQEHIVEVCVPSLQMDCQPEEVGPENDMNIHVEDDCHDVIRTLCSEQHLVEEYKVCAFSYELKPVATEAKLVEVEWNKVCNEVTVCVAPFSYAPNVCHDQIQETCSLEPSLVPVVRPLTIQMPHPVEVCITKQVDLPHIDCVKAVDRHCMPLPVHGKESHTSYQDKCNFTPGPPICTDTSVILPIQSCAERIENVAYRQG